MVDKEGLQEGLELAITHTRMRRGHHSVGDFEGGIMVGIALGLGLELGPSYGEVLERSLEIASLRRDKSGDTLANNLDIELQARKDGLIGKRSNPHGVLKSTSPVEQVIELAVHHAGLIASTGSVEDAISSIEEYAFRLRSLQQAYERSRRG